MRLQKKVFPAGGPDRYLSQIYPDQARQLSLQFALIKRLVDGWG